MERIRQRGSIGWLARLIATALLAMATMTASTASVRAADGRDWRVSDIKGDAQVKTGDAWRALKRGDMVEPGSQVKTGAAARLILVRPGDSLDVAPDSEFNVPKAADAGKDRPATHISQSRGTILFKITTRPENPFTVKTPYLAAVIKGTTFTVSVDRDDAALHVSKGAVQVASILTGQTVLVGPGQTAAVNARNGGAMRLIGFERRGAGGAPDPAKDASIESGEGKAGRGNLTTVIPNAVGVTDVDIGKLSKGLVSERADPATGPDDSANLHRKSGRGEGKRKGKGKGKKGLRGNGIGASPLFSNPVPSMYRGGQGNGTVSDIGNGKGKGNANRNGNGNHGGNGNGNGNGKKN